MLNATLRQIGGSTVVAIPPALLAELGLSAKAKVSIRIEAGRIIIEPNRRPRYTLDELLAACDPARDPHSDEQDWLAGRAIGAEEI